MIKIILLLLVASTVVSASDSPVDNIDLLNPGPFILPLPNLEQQASITPLEQSAVVKAAQIIGRIFEKQRVKEFNLLTLPLERQVDILSSLNIRDLLALARVSKEYNLFVKSYGILIKRLDLSNEASVTPGLIKALAIYFPNLEQLIIDPVKSEGDVLWHFSPIENYDLIVAITTLFPKLNYVRLRGKEDNISAPYVAGICRLERWRKTSDAKEPRRLLRITLPIAEAYKSLYVLTRDFM